METGLELVQYSQIMTLEWVMGHHVDTIKTGRFYSTKQLDRLLLNAYLDKRNEVNMEIGFTALKGVDNA